MSNYGSFEYGSGVVYGHADPVVVSDVEIITPTLIRITYSTEIITNSSFFDKSNYSLKLYGKDYSDVNTKSILPVYKDDSDELSLVSTYSLLETDPLTIGSRYTLTISNLVSRNGTELTSSPFHRTAIRTKTSSMLKEIPSHFDKRPTSLISSLITAIGISDDSIGGSKFERI